MSAYPARRGLMAAALARAESFLLEPAEPAVEPQRPPAAGKRPVVTVFGLGRGVGCTTVARALAAELAARDPGGTAAVSSPLPSAAIPLASPAAGRLARTLADVPGGRTRAVGRLCLVEAADEVALTDTARHHAPCVLDAGCAAVGGAPAALADRVVLVARPSVEPALAAVAAACVARVADDPLIVLNRAAADDARWSGRAALELPDSRMGAQLALGGREPRGALGDAVAELADRCEDEAG